MFKVKSSLWSKTILQLPKSLVNLRFSEEYNVFLFESRTGKHSNNFYTHAGIQFRVAGLIFLCFVNFALVSRINSGTFVGNVNKVT